MSARVDAVAKGLIQLGIAPGDKVALWMVNCPEWIDAMFAIMQIGAVLVPVNTRFRTEDMAYVLGQSDAVAVILGDRSGPVDYLAMLREAVPSLGAGRDARAPALRHVIVLSDRAHAETVDRHSMVEDGRHLSDRARRERAVATGSSGSSGGQRLSLGDCVMGTGTRVGRPPPEGARVAYAPLYVAVQAAAAHGIRRRHRSTGAMGGEVTVAPRSVCTWK